MVLLRRLKNNFLAAMLFCLTFSFIHAQSSDSARLKLPYVTLRTLDNKIICTNDITNVGKTILLIFWKSCCSPNIKMLDEISEVYSEWQKETGVVIYAVSIDDSRSSSKIAPLVNSKGWEFTVLLDVNSDFKRAMNVVATPHVFVLNGSGEVIWQKTTYNPGEVNEIYNVIKSIKP
jgi:peroxiredoxin